MREFFIAFFIDSVNFCQLTVAQGTGDRKYFFVVQRDDMLSFQGKKVSDTNIACCFSGGRRKNR
ncbi:MAG: hypothetical protein D3916_04800 [Candidatus Electrothrix sp. MAN1_4]|nr:hypothetical protein [Candidatus Electrothrix sp. MAN1_4]